MTKNLITKDYNNVVTSYWFWADQFLMANQVEKGIIWMINNFINIKFNSDWFPGGIYFANNEYRNKMVEFYDCPFFRTQKILYDTEKKVAGEGIIDFSINNIEKNRFVLLRVDRFFLNRGKKGNEHEILLHGYDIKEKKFYYSDNDSTGKFAIDIPCSFDELEKALNNVNYFADEPDLSDSIFTFDVYSNELYGLNLRGILSQLNQYLNNVQLSFDGLYRNGICIYDALIEHFIKVIEEEYGQYDWRGLCVIKDHKSVMVERIRYLSDVLKVKFESLDMYIELKNKCNLLVALYLKYGYTKNKNNIHRMIEILKNVYEMERSALEKLIYEIERIV